MSRKEIDQLTESAKQAGAGGLAYIIMDKEGPRSPILKFFSEEEVTYMVSATDAKKGDILFFGVGSQELVARVLNRIRLELRDKFNLADPSHLAFAWITDFPFYEYDEDNESWDFGHNPFSHVVGGLDALDTDEL